jgi:alpha-ketoglutarate-dependent taurine dioxygenase
MARRIVPTGATLGAVVAGVRLDALSDSEWRAIEAAFLEYAVLLFPAQHPSRETQVAFGRRFGELDSLVAKTGSVAISNVEPDGTLMDDAAPAKQLLRGNEGWHTDSSYMPVSALASLLSAEVVTERGGETEWADMRAAYDALDPAMRSRIADLSAYHSIRYSQARAGLASAPGGALYYGFDGSGAPLRPLVKRHPVTGRPALFIGRHAYGIPGLAPEESERLLDELLAFACQPPRVLRHVWRPGDLAIWDNRCVLHRARPYDPRVPRVLHHTRIAGDPRTESALPSAPGVASGVGAA